MAAGTRSAAWQIVKTSPATNGEVGVLDLHPGMVATIGRGPQLPDFGRVDHKYISRVHCTIRLVAGTDASSHVVVVQQVGKNPTLAGPLATQLATQAETCAPSFVVNADAGSEAAKQFKHAHTVHSTTLYFPLELNLPMFHIHFLAPLGAKGNATAPGGVSHKESDCCVEGHALESDESHISGVAAEASAIVRMMTVPVGLEDSDDDEVPPPARQMRLLDEALRQQAVANAAEKTRAEECANWVQPQSSRAIIAPCARAESCGSPSANTAAPQKQRNSDEKEVIRVGGDDSSRASAAAKPRLDTQAATVQSTSRSAPSSTMGFWEWKCHVDGDDKDPKNWRKYAKTTADKLEAAYTNDQGKVGSIAIDAVYNVCFDDARIGMAQYRKDNPARWRSVRRRGGDAIARPKAKKKHFLRDTGFTSSSSSSSSGDSSDDERPSWIVSDDSEDASTDDDSDDDASFDTESSIETESSERKKRTKKNKQKAMGPLPKKRSRDA